jgi:abequosyltransferase
MPARLSICLPVYNFASFLGETLDSILPQCAPGVVEVVVVDGASTDNTSDVVADRMAAWTNLRYVRLERRGGIDVDMARSVENVSGEYCWLFSGDDIMRPGAVSRVLTYLDAGDDVIICRHTICDRHMRFLGDYPILRSPGARRLDFADAAQRQSFLGAALNTEALFSFMSGLIIRRQAWLSVGAVDNFTGSCWGHVARLLSLARQRLLVCYSDELWLDKRGDNDSFMDRGAVHRFSIAVDGYMRIASTYYGADSFEAIQVNRFLRNELTIASFMSARQSAAESPALESRRELDRLMNVLYRDRSLLTVLTRFVYRFFPLWLYGGLRTALRAVRPWMARRGFVLMR